MPEPKVINVRESWGIETTTNDDGTFVIAFTTSKLCVNLHCNRSSLWFIAKELWSVIWSEDKQIARMRAVMKGE